MSTVGHYPTDVSDAQWEVLHLLLPMPQWCHGRLGRTPLDLRRIIYGIFAVNKTGCQWRMMPTDSGNRHTIYGSFAVPMLLIDVPTSTPTACCPDCHAPSARVPSPLYTPAARSARRRAAGAPPRACPAFPVFYIHLAAPHVCGAPPGAGSGPGPADGAVDGDAPGPRRRGRRPSGRTPGDSPAAARAWRHRPPAPPRLLPRVLGIDDCALRMGRG